MLLIWKITDIGRGKKTWREQASPSVTFPYLRDSKILILFQNIIMHFVYSTTKYRNLRLKRATYVKFRCISAVETITLWRRRKKKTDDVTMSNKCTRLYKALTEFSYGLPSYLYAIILEVVAVLKLLCLNTILRHIISIKRISAS